jgi:hypothetical protein
MKECFPQNQVHYPLAEKTSSSRPGDVMRCDVMRSSESSQSCHLSRSASFHKRAKGRIATCSLLVSFAPHSEHQSGATRRRCGCGCGCCCCGSKKGSKKGRKGSSDVQDIKNIAQALWEEGNVQHTPIRRFENVLRARSGTVSFESRVNTWKRWIPFDVILQNSFLFCYSPKDLPKRALLREAPQRSASSLLHSVPRLTFPVFHMRPLNIIII